MTFNKNTNISVYSVTKILTLPYMVLMDQQVFDFVKGTQTRVSQRTTLLFKKLFYHVTSCKCTMELNRFTRC